MRAASPEIRLIYYVFDLLICSRCDVMGELHQAPLRRYRVLIAGADHCVGSELERFIRFCGLTRMTPLREASKSAIIKNAIATTSGNTQNRLALAAVLRAL